MLLETDELLIGWRGQALLPPLSFRFERGQTWALVGPNGGGKSTLMRTLLGLMPAVGGAIRVEPGIRLGYVPQRGAVDPALPARVLDVVWGGVERGWSFASPLHRWRSRGLVGEALASAELEGLAEQSFHELSEGQKQRVLLARALASGAQALILDEPTSAMDPEREGAAFQLLEDLRAELDLGLLVASHRMGFLPRFASHVLFVDKDRGEALAAPVQEAQRSGPLARWLGAQGVGTHA